MGISCLGWYETLLQDPSWASATLRGTRLRGVSIKMEFRSKPSSAYQPHASIYIHIYIYISLSVCVSTFLSIIISLTISLSLPPKASPALPACALAAETPLGRREAGSQIPGRIQSGSTTFWMSMFVST